MNIQIPSLEGTYVEKMSQMPMFVEEIGEKQIKTNNIEVIFAVTKLLKQEAAELHTTVINHFIYLSYHL